MLLAIMAVVEVQQSFRILQDLEGSQKRTKLNRIKPERTEPNAARNGNGVAAAVVGRRLSVV